jgi:hypothetical protein
MNGHQESGSQQDHPERREDREPLEPIDGDAEPVQALEATDCLGIAGDLRVPRTVDHRHQHLTCEHKAGQGDGGERGGPAHTFRASRQQRQKGYQGGCAHGQVVPREDLTDECAGGLKRQLGENQGCHDRGEEGHATPGQGECETGEQLKI